MRIIYRYNEETCQYERVGIKAPDVVFYISGIVVTSVLMLIAMLMLHDYFFDSPKEIALRMENAALRNNYSLLTSHLEEIEVNLDQLSDEDRKLQEKLFGVSVGNSSDQDQQVVDRKILLSSPSEFRKTLRKVDQQSSTILDNIGKINQFFSGTLSVRQKDIGSCRRCRCCSR